MTPGTVVIAGRTYQITGLRLRDGKLQITAYGGGPSPAVSDEPAAVFGEDGLGVCQSWHVTIPELGSHENVHIILPIQITHMDEPEGESKIIWR
jgi:hypothetical protein